MKNQRHKTTRTARPLALAAAALLILAPSAARADSLELGGNSNGNTQALQQPATINYENVNVGIGSGSHNTLNIDNEGSVNVSETLSIGKGSYSQGNQINVYANSALNTTGAVTIGEEGSYNTLNISADGALNIRGDNPTVTIGDGTDSAGNTLRVQDGGSLTFQSPGLIIVGYVNTGESSGGNTLDIQGTANTHHILAGYESSGNAITIGSTGLLNSSGNITIGSGDGGGNSLTIAGRLDFTGVSNELTIGFDGSSGNVVSVAAGGSIDFTNSSANGLIGVGISISENFSDNNKLNIDGKVKTNTLAIGSAYNYGNQVTIANGGVLIASSDVYIGSGGDSSGNTLLVNGGELYAGTIHVGLDFGSGNTFAVNGGQADVDTVNIGTGGGSGNLLQVGDFGELEVSGNLNVGYLGTAGTATVLEDGHISAGAVNIGTGDSTDDSALTIQARGVLDTGSVTLGYAASPSEYAQNNTLTIEAGGKLNTSSVSTGAAYYANGNTLTIAEGGQLNADSAATFTIGNYSLNNALNVNGQLNIEGSATVNIGQDGYSNALNINGGEVNIGGTGTLTIGSGNSINYTNNSNYLDITNGGKLDIEGQGTITVGSYGSISNSFYISGPGSQLNIHGDGSSIVVGYSGQEAEWYNNPDASYYIGNSVSIGSGGQINLSGDNSAVTVGEASVGNDLSIYGGSQLNLSGINSTITVGLDAEYYHQTGEDEGYYIGNSLTIAGGGEINLTGEHSNYVIVGDKSVGNTLTIQSGGKLNLSGQSYLADPSAFGDQVTVGNAGGSGNSLIINQGGELNFSGPDATVAVGYNKSDGNSLTILGQLNFSGDNNSDNGSVVVGSRSNDNILTIGNGGQLTLNQNSQLNLGSGGANNIFTVERGGTLNAASSTFHLATSDNSRNNTLNILGTASLKYILVGGYSEEYPSSGVDGNRLHVDGTLNAAHIELYATSILSGHGVINVTSDSTLVLHSGSILDISGDTGTGTLTINDGPVTFEAGAILDFNLAPASGASDLLALNGQSIDLSGVLFQFDVLEAFTMDLAFNLITGAGSIVVDTGAVYDLGGGYTGRLSVIDGDVAGKTLLLAASAVPEPSTYAALAGLALLVFAMIRRRPIHGR